MFCRSGQKEKPATNWTTWFYLTRPHTISSWRRCQATSWSHHLSFPSVLKLEDRLLALLSRNWLPKVKKNSSISYCCRCCCCSKFKFTHSFSRSNQNDFETQQPRNLHKDSNRWRCRHNWESIEKSFVFFPIKK